MGTGGPLEAAFTLGGAIDAGQWRLVADCIVLEEVDIRFELLWRSPAGDQPIATWDDHFTPLPSGFDSQPYEVTAEAPAVAATAGDLLVFRYSCTSTATLEMSWLPNGEGARSGGRIPFVELP